MGGKRIRGNYFNKTSSNNIERLTSRGLNQKELREQNIQSSKVATLLWLENSWHSDHYSSSGQIKSSVRKRITNYSYQKFGMITSKSNKRNENKNKIWKKQKDKQNLASFSSPTILLFHHRKNFWIQNGGSRKQEDELWCKYLWRKLNQEFINTSLKIYHNLLFPVQQKLIKIGDRNGKPVGVA